MLEKKQIGVALTKRACFVCAKIEDGEIVINKEVTERGAKEAEKLHGALVGWLDKPCEECQKHMEQGIIIITIDSERTKDETNPHRTGGLFLVTEDYIKRLIDNDDKLLTEILKHRFTFIEHKMAEALGFFNQKTDEDENK